MANGNWLHASHLSFFLTGETRLFNYHSLPLSPPILYSLQCDKPPFTSLSHHPSQSSSSFKDSLLKHWTKPRDVCHFTILSFSEFPHSFRGAYPLFSLTQLPSQWYNPSIINKYNFLSLVSQNSINNNFFELGAFWFFCLHLLRLRTDSAWSASSLICCEGEESLLLIPSDLFMLL